MWHSRFQKKHIFLWIWAISENSQQTTDKHEHKLSVEFKFIGEKGQVLSETELKEDGKVLRLKF